MTIDEIIEQLKKLKSFHNGSYGASVNFAIDIVRKYQKIEALINSWELGLIDNIGYEIEEVLEDGNDN